MNLYHYSASPFALDKARAYEQMKDYFKPRGLWLSAEDETDSGWKQWCEGEEFNLSGLAYRTEIELLPVANILRISTALELDAFTNTFRAPARYCGIVSINWFRVVTLYDGIIISPYIWERRLDRSTFWYYSWDCASACIWNSRVIDVVGRSSEVAAA